MKHIRSKLFVIVLTSLLFVIMGCQQDTGLTSSVTDTQDDDLVAISIAGSIGENSGGVLDQIGDVAQFASEDGFVAGLAKMSDEAIAGREATYDSVSQTWTVNVTRENGSPGDSIYGHRTRVLYIQFQDSAGNPQKRYIWKGDTARTIDFEIVSGTGHYTSPTVSRQLKSITAAWTATNAHTELLTINGTYQRAAISTVTKSNKTRISDHQINLNIQNLVGPRGSRRDLSQKVSGTITGTFTATVEVLKEDVTITREIERDITITIENGEVDIQVDTTRFTSDAQTGNVEE